MSASTLSDPPVASIPRRHDLDALRAFAMLLGIALHGALSFAPQPDTGWPVHDARQSESYSVFMSVVHGFRMPLFFLVSGFFTAMLWRKRGLAALLNHRARRILLPLVIGMFTLVPAVWVVIIGAGIAGIGSSGNVSLWQAARDGDLAAIEQHWVTEPDLDAVDPAAGSTPLSVAAARGHSEVVAWLVAHGADVNVRDRDGGTSLHAAVSFGEVEAAQFLIDRGVDPAAKNRLGQTAEAILDQSWTRTIVMASFMGIQPDAARIAAGREEIRPMLSEPGGTAEVIEATPEQRAQAARAGQVAGLLILLTLFPVFHHLWFLWFLCLLVAMFAVYAKASDVLKWKTPRRLIVSPLRYVWLIPLTMIPQSMMGWLYPNFGPDTSGGLLPMLPVLGYYVIFFFFGAMYFDSDDGEGRVGRWWRVTLPVALFVVFPLGYELSVGGLGFSGTRILDSGWCRPLSVLLQVVYVWLMSFGLMGMFRDVLSVESRTLRYISDSSYWLYLVHLPLIIVAQAIVRAWPMPAMVKFTLICTVITALLLLTYQWCVRYTPIGTMLNGPRRRAEPIIDAVLAEPSAQA